MEIPELVRRTLGDEEIDAGVSLGDEDAVCFTPTRTLVYRGEGLLSDESVSEFPHDIERLDVSEGRRKTKFVLTYVDGRDSFTVPSNRGETVLERLMEGILRVAGVVDADESVTGVYRFSELTLVVTESRLVRHIGEAVWEDDVQQYAYADLTGLDFEKGSVATQVVVEVDGRPERIKAPNDQARDLQKTIESAVFSYHGVGSLEELNATVGDDESGEAESSGDDGGSGSLEFGDGIDPLVSDPGDSGGGTDAGGGSDAGTGPGAGGRESTEAAGHPGSPTQEGEGTAGERGIGEGRGGSVGSHRSDADLADIEDRLAELTAAVERQNELLEKHDRTLKRLIEELRQGR